MTIGDTIVLGLTESSWRESAGQRPHVDMSLRSTPPCDNNINLAHQERQCLNYFISDCGFRFPFLGYKSTVEIHLGESDEQNHAWDLMAKPHAESTSGNTTLFGLSRKPDFELADFSLPPKTIEQ